MSQGCKCGSESDKPYTPFGVVTELAPQASSSADAATAASALLAWQQQTTEVLSPSQSSLNLSWPTERDEKRLYTLVIEANFDADAELEAVAWSVPKHPTEAMEAGQLWYFEPDAPRRKLAGFPNFVPAGPGCRPQVTLTHSGVHSVTLDVQTTCEGMGPPGSANRAVSIVAPARRSPVLLELKLASPDRGFIEVVSDTKDLDGDGHDDVTLLFELRSQPRERDSKAAAPKEPRARLPMRWFDRPSGMARDDTEPATSLKSKGSVEVVRSRGKSTSRGLADRLNAYRSLAAYLCDEGGTPKLTDQDGQALGCGNLSTALGFFTLAEGRAALTQGDVRGALGALGRNHWYLGEGSSGQRKKLESDIRKRTTTVTPKERLFGVTVTQPGPGPQYAPLWFDDAGKLHALSPFGVLRLEGNQFHDVSEGVDPWPQIVTRPGGARLSGAFYPCAKEQVEIQAQDRGGRFVSALVTNILSPRPGYCRSPGAFVAPKLRLIQWNATGLSALLGAQWLGSQNVKPAPGSPVSNNGRHYVASTMLGLVLGDQQRIRLIELDRSDELGPCVVNNAGSSVACLRGDAVSVLELSP